MNESWRQAEADAHEAKADALGIAGAALRGCEGALSPLAWQQAESLLISVEHEAGRARAGRDTCKGDGDSMNSKRATFALVLPITGVSAAIGAVLGWWGVLVAMALFLGAWAVGELSE